MISIIFCTLCSAPKTRRALVLENRALHHQLDVLQGKARRPKFRNRERILWGLLSRIWTDSRRSLTIVQPETVIGGKRRRGNEHKRRCNAKDLSHGLPPF
jgi:hypothetical protein